MYSEAINECPVNEKMPLLQVTAYYLSLKKNIGEDITRKFLDKLYASATKYNPEIEADFKVQIMEEIYRMLAVWHGMD